MLELEFLPSWYAQVRHRRRIVEVQACVLILLIIGAATWMTLQKRSIRHTQLTLDSLGGQLNETAVRQRMLSEQLSLRKELQKRGQLIASLGYPVDNTRLLQTLDRIMPKEMSLTDFSAATSEETVALPTGQIPRANDPKQIDRRLKVRMVGVAPSDTDLANFLTGLTSVSFFDQVALTYTHPKTDEGHVMREFEVTFSINLNQSAGT